MDGFFGGYGFLGWMTFGLGTKGKVGRGVSGRGVSGSGIGSEVLVGFCGGDMGSSGPVGLV